MSTGNSIRSSSRWLISGSMGAQVLNFLFGIILARLLTPADFGAIVTIQIFTGIAGYIAGGGTSEALVQAREVKNYYFNVIFSLQMAIGIALFSFFFVFATWFGEWYENPLYTDLMRVSAITFLTRPFAAIPMAKLRRDMRFREISIINIAVLVGANLTSIVLAIFGWGAWSFIIGGIVGSLVRIASAVYLTHWLPLFHFDKGVLRKLGSYGIKTSVNDILSYAHSQASNLLISSQGGASAVGLFNKADSLKSMPLMAIGNPVYQPIFRSLSKEQQNTDKSIYIYMKSISLLSVYMLPLYTGLFWTASAFIETVYGQQWASAALPLTILALCGPTFCIGSPSGAVIAAQNKLHKEIVVGMANLALIVAGAFIGYKLDGLTGVAWALLLVELNSSFWFSRIATSSLSIDHSRAYKALIPGLALNGILFLSLYCCDFLLGNYVGISGNSAIYLVTMSLAGGIVYLAAFLYLPIRAIEPEARRWKEKLRLPTRSQPRK